MRSLFSGFYRVFVQFLSVVIHVFPRTNRMPNRVHGAVESCCFLKKKNLLLFSVVEGVSTDFNEASVFTCVERTVTSVYYFLMNLDSPVIRALFVTARLRFVVCFALLLFFFLVFALTILRVSCSFLGPADTWLLTFGSDVFLLVFVDFLTGLYLVLPVFFLLLAFFRHC